MKSKLTLPVIFLIFLIIPVFAVEDFSASTTPRISGFQCSPSQNTITITNTGTETSTYLLFSEGRTSDWTAFSPDFFTLAPGQSKTVQELITIPCDAEEGTHYIDVVIQSDTIEKVLSHELIVRKPQNIQLIPEVFEQSILPCGSAEFSFTLHNPGLFTETYTLEVDNEIKETLLSHDSVTLDSKENQTIFVRVNPQNCRLAGDFNPVLVVKTEKSSLIAEIDMFLQVNKTGIASIAEGVSTIKTTYAAQQAEITIENKGDKRITYTLLIDGPDWVRVEPSEVTVDRNDRETVRLIMTPDESTIPGKHSITLTATADETGVDYTKTFTIKLKGNRFVDKVLDEYLPFTIAGITILTVLLILLGVGIKKYNSPEAKAKREEKRAQKEEKKRQKQEEKERKREEKERERLELEREKERVKREHERELKKEYKLVAKKDIVKGKKLPSKFGLKLTLIFLILVILGITASQWNAIVQNLGSAILGVALLVGIIIVRRAERARKTSKKWKLVLANEQNTLNTKWKKGLKTISFTISSPVEKLKVLTKKIKAKDAPGKVYQAFNVQHNIADDEISEARYNFAVKRSWLRKHNIQPSTVKLVQEKAGKWRGVSTRITRSDEKFVHYEAKTSGFGTLAITGKPQKKKTKPLRALGYTGLGVLLVLVIVLALSFFIPTTQTPRVTQGIPDQVWAQDTQHSLDLNPYFKDPDGDKLEFRVTKTKNVDVTITNDGIAVFTPLPGWSGIEKVVFTADDGKGGTAQSNPVRLVVRKTLIPAATKPYLLVGTIILALILAIFLFRQKIKKFLEE